MEVSIDAVTMQTALCDSVHGSKECQLADLLVDMCSWGFIQWSFAQSVAERHCRDNISYGQWNHPSMRKLAKLGKHGQYSGNARRDALKNFPPAIGNPETYDILVPIMKTKGDQSYPTMSWIPIIMPNLLFEAIYKWFRPVFDSFLGAGLEQFWNQVHPEDPRIHNHPMLSVPDWKKKFVPLLLHGDGAGFTQRSNSMLLITMAFFFGSRLVSCIDVFDCCNAKGLSGTRFQCGEPRFHDRYLDLAMPWIQGISVRNSSIGRA